MRVATRLLLAMSALAAVPGAARAALIHDYEFTDGLADAVAGGPALVTSFTAGGTGSVAGGFYSFTAGGGLQLGSQLPGTVYTIDISVALDTLSGYRKLVSFETIAATKDAGLYDLNGALNLYGHVTSPTTTDFVAGQLVDVRVSRDAAGLVTGYINGVQKLSYLDTAGEYTANTSLYFLRDDLDQNSEQSGGRADYIRIYDTADTTTTPPAAVPEPATWATMVGGFGLIGAALRGRRRGRALA